MFCTKKRLQWCIKVLAVVSIIGVYFIVLLRESFAAWESTSLSSITTTSVGLTNRDEVKSLQIVHCKFVCFYVEYGMGFGMLNYENKTKYTIKIIIIHVMSP